MLLFHQLRQTNKLSIQLIRKPTPAVAIMLKKIKGNKTNGNGKYFNL